VRESIAQARTGAAGRAPADSAARGTDDSAVSADDEDIDVSGDVGRSVIERVLGGKVIRELDE
jgi:DNA polymerase-3 subunit gamma/tau